MEIDKIISFNVDSKYGKKEVKIELYSSLGLLPQDEEEFDDFGWKVLKNKNKYYIGRSVKIGEVFRTQYLHRFLAEMHYGKKALKNRIVDHINGDGLDNRLSNVRLVTPQQNCFNRLKSKNKTSVFKGVWLSPTQQKWFAKVEYNSNRIHLGTYINEVEAAFAYDIAARFLFENYATKNIYNDRLESNFKGIGCFPKAIRKKLIVAKSEAK